MRFRYSVLLLLFLSLSCTKKDTKICYTCTTTYLVVTDQPVPNYPAQTSIENEICEVTEEQVKDFETVNKGSDVQIIGGVTYTSSFSTRCIKQ